MLVRSACVPAVASPKSSPCTTSSSMCVPMALALVVSSPAVTSPTAPTIASLPSIVSPTSIWTSSLARIAGLRIGRSSFWRRRWRWWKLERRHRKECVVKCVTSATWAITCQLPEVSRAELENLVDIEEKEICVTRRKSAPHLHLFLSIALARSAERKNRHSPNESHSRSPPRC